MDKLLGTRFGRRFALVAAFMLCFSVTALPYAAMAQGSDAMSQDPVNTGGEVSPAVLVELGAQLVKAIGNRDWRSLGALLVTLLVLGVRWLAKKGPALPKWKWLAWLGRLASWLNTDRGGAIASIAISVLLLPIGALLGGANPLSWAALGAALLNAATATGTFVLLKKLWAPSDKPSLKPESIVKEPVADKPLEVIGGR